MRGDTSGSRLIRLSDTALMLEKPGEDIRHYRVLDSEGNDVGKVTDLYIDEQERKVRFLLVRGGGFLGLGAEHYLIPIDAVKEITTDRVVVAHSVEHIAGAPRYDPELIEEQGVAAVYGYYGYGPYWGPTYVYPTYPFFGPR